VKWIIQTELLKVQTEFTTVKQQPLLYLLVVGGGIQPKVIKKVSVIGGIGDMWGEQYRQQYRVIDSKQVSYALSAELQNVKVVRSAKKIR
jgi:hypothetical protein